MREGDSGEREGLQEVNANASYDDLDAIMTNLLTVQAKGVNPSRKAQRAATIRGMPMPARQVLEDGSNWWAIVGKRAFLFGLWARSAGAARLRWLAIRGSATEKA